MERNSTKSLSDSHPDIAQQWNYNKNENITPDEVTYGSNKKVWWICDNNHEWEAPIKNRTTKKSGCPYCSGVKLLTGFNDVETVFNESGLHKELHQWSDHNDFSACEVSARSSVKYIWICDKEHSFEQSPRNRLRGQGCPYCANRKLLTGFNDIATYFQEICNYWDIENNDKSPREILCGSTYVCNLICPMGHHFSTRAYDIYRAQKISCPECVSMSKSRRLEQNDKKAQVKNRYIQAKKYEKYGHLEHMFDSSNEDEFFSAVRHPTRIYKWLCDKGHHFDDSMIDVAARKNLCLYCSGDRIIPGENDFFVYHKTMIDMWDVNKNGCLDRTLKTTSHKLLHWICDKGHSFVNSPYSINKLKNSTAVCPYCSNRKLLVGFNSLYDKFPSIVDSYWDFDNNKIRPDEVLCVSSSVVAWVCDKGHHYEDTVRHKICDGRGCPVCANKKIIIGVNDIFTTSPHLRKMWDFNKNIIDPNTVGDGSFQKAWFICEKGHSYFSRIVDRKRFDCPQCAHTISSAEVEIYQFLCDIINESIRIDQSRRDIISPYELDIYIPEKNIAVEYNGLYWHTESQGKDRYYHYNKWKMCRDLGIQLITVWEDDWLYHQDIVKNFLSHKLDVSDQNKIYARNTVVREVDYHMAQEFLDNHHIQGSSAGTQYYGLFSHRDNKLCAISVWRKNKSVLYLDRYATSQIVVGGMGKLLKQGIQYARNNSLTKIITFSDHEVSDGQLYEKLGFAEDKELKPDYKYVHQGKRVHKFNFRKKRFSTDPELLYSPDLTEKQLAELNKIDKVYDCGKTRWIMDIS